MSFNEFGCERVYIEKVLWVVHRNVLIELYCGDDFDFINLVDFYYRKTNSNAILMFLFICAIYPILFMCVAAIADKYLAVGMQDLSEKLHLSPTLAAITLIAFANGAPDILSSMSAAGKADGALISVGALFGSFIFASTLVIFNVVISSPKVIQFPKWAITKELGFYALSVIVVSIFGLIGTAGYPFVFTYLSIYVTYLITSILIERMDNK